MTKKELASFINMKEPRVSNAIAELNELGIIPVRKRTFSYSRKDTINICRHLGCSEIEIALLDEHLKETVTRSDIYIDGNEEFISRQERNRSIHTCGNCSYCIARSKVGLDSTTRPYCSFYEKFIRNMKVEVRGKIRNADLFKDGCETWRRGAPRLWKK